MTGLDARILGTGIVSRCVALGLAHRGLRVGLQAAPGRGPAVQADVRAYALNAASVALLTSLKVWDALPADARTPVEDMRICGDRPGAELAFSAWSQAVPALAWIVEAAALEQVLEAAVGFSPGISRQTEPGPAALSIVAEGKASASRQALAVHFQRNPYPQSALATRLISDQPHAGLARQWFRSPDVLALLPFDRPEPGHSYALVWSLPSEQAARWCEAPAAELEEALDQATSGAAGRLRVAGPCATWPLAQGQADSVCGPGWMLIGDAAHCVHPLAGQGLNLGLADVTALVDTLAARESWRGLGDETLLRRYARRRLAATWAMTRLTDGLWRLYAQQHEGVKALRHHGLRWVNAAPGLKRWLTARALGT